MDAIFKDHTHLVVDEFQDTTGIQWRISKLLIGKGICFLGAGDPYQTIHRYAGASLKRFAQLEAIRGCKTFELTENHRSTKQVVDLANGLLSQNCEGLSNKVKAKKTGPKPRVYLANYRPLLYQAIIKLIRRHMKQGMKLSDIAMVARFDSDLKQFMPTLDKCKVPYVFFSKQAKEEPIALKAYRSVLKIALNDGDKSSWATILPFLSGVGKKAATDILKILKQNRYHHSALTGYLTTHRKGDLEALLKLIAVPQQCGDRPLRVGLKALEFMRGLRKRIRDLDSYSATITEMASGTPTIGDLFLSCNEISFGAHHNRNRNYKSKGELTLGNIHQIKGREFKAIFVLGSPDRLFENHKTFNNKLKIADELFVMLTAVTHTKKHLYLLFQMTHDEWQKKQYKRNPSIFIRNCRRKSYRTYSVAESPPKKKLIMRGRNGG